MPRTLDEIRRQHVEAHLVDVHTAARVLGIAAPGEVLVSGTVKDFSDAALEPEQGRHGVAATPGT